MLIKAGCASTPHLLVVVPVKRRAGLRLRLVVFPARARSAVVRLLKQKVHLIAAREVSNNEGVGEHVRMDGPMEGGGSRGWPSLGRVNPQSRHAASLARLLLLLWLYYCCCGHSWVPVMSMGRNGAIRAVRKDGINVVGHAVLRHLHLLASNR